MAVTFLTNEDKTNLESRITELDRKITDVESTIPADAIRYTQQTLTDEQKAQARENIGASAAEETVDITEKCKQFSALMNNTDNVESFIFFTDPHLAEASGYEDQLHSYTQTLADYYHTTPTSFVLCGGDWIGNSDTQAQACFKLGCIDGLMKKLFAQYYMVVGNHDTNYQGVTVEGAAAYSGTLTNETIRNLWLRDEDKLYYSFKGVNTQFYVLDTGSDWATGMTDYRWEQVAWLAERLKSDDAIYSAIVLHIGGDPLAQNVYTLCNAYNQATTITLNEVTYDFTGCTGKVKFALAGHTHEDSIDVINDILVVTTTHMRMDGTPTFDLCLADYDADVLYLTRVGSGENRTISLLDGSIIDTDSNETSGANVVPTAKALISNEILNGVGYADGYRLDNDPPYKNATEGYVLVGRFAYDTDTARSLYIKGDVQWLDTNYCRVAVFDETTFVDELRYAQLSVIQLADGYYRIDLPILSQKTGYCGRTMSGTHLALSLYGTGEGLVVTIDEPITNETDQVVDEHIVFLPGIGASNGKVIVYPQRMLGVSSHTYETIPPMRNDSSYTDSYYYPLTIPIGASKVTCNCPSELKWGFSSMHEDTSAGDMFIAYDSGWLDANTELSLSAVNESYYRLIFKKTDESVFAADYDTSGITIEWGYD